MYIYIWNSHVVKNWFVFVRQAAGECVRAVCENVCVSWQVHMILPMIADMVCVFLVLFFNIRRWFDCFETFGWQLPPGELHMQFKTSYSIGRKDSWHQNRGVSKLPNFYIDAPVCQSFFGFGDWRLLFVFVAFSHMFGSRSMFFWFQSCRLCWSCLFAIIVYKVTDKKWFEQNFKSNPHQIPILTCEIPFKSQRLMVRSPLNSQFWDVESLLNAIFYRLTPPQLHHIFSNVKSLSNPFFSISFDR